ncbi:WD40 repeat domain-containing serine/threonine protein kinase [Streptomyces sp. NPDC048332]|uniref:WD40 repeat domain-containing serine/threonine protein kinase n=1 Tax=Streptomyces sp. NPDC048332 TaxID=3154619 RepID=UPI0034447724
MGGPLTANDPERIGAYWLAARLGQGSQGVVYEAYDARGTRVALKALHRDAHESVRGRFAKEVAAARRVDSFCTARILDASVEASPSPDIPHIVSEYIPGPTLAARVYEDGALPEGAAVRLATGVATALAAIHRAEVIHRDLKPGNVVLGPDGPRVIDFGIARAPDMSLTGTEGFVGTLGYMAPEVLAGKPATYASDIFAWGALVLFAFTGTEPFRGATFGEVVYRTVQVRPDLTGVPSRLRPLVSAALSQDPGLRPLATDVLLGLVGSTPASADPRLALLGAGVSGAATPEEERPGDVPSPDLGTRAETAFTALPTAVHGAVRELLMRLVVPGGAPDGSQDMVRTASHDELFAERAEEEAAPARQALAALVESGAALVAPDGSVRPVSAALLRAWPRLRSWTDEDRDGLPVRHQLGRAAELWEQSGRRADDLLGGSSLRRTLGWAATSPPHLRLSPLERRFLSASRQHGARAAKRQRRLLSSLAVLLVTALLAGGLAWQQQRENERQEAREQARTMAESADRMRVAEPVTAMLLSVGAWRLSPTPDARAALYAAAAQHQSDSLLLPVAKSGDYQLHALSPDGRRLVRALDGHVEVWDVRRKRRVSRQPLRGTTSSTVNWLTDANLRLLALIDEGSAVRLMDPERGTAFGDPVPLPPGMSLAGISGDGKVLLVGTADSPRVQLWDAASGAGLLLDLPYGADAAAVAPDGSQVAYCQDHTAALWDLSGSRPAQVSLDAPEDPWECDERNTAGEVLFSPDGKKLGISSGQGGRQLMIWNAKDGELLGPATTGITRVFSDDGRFLVSASSDSGVEIAPASESVHALFRDFVPGRDGEDGRDVTAMAFDAEARKLVFVADGLVLTVDVPGSLSTGTLNGSAQLGYLAPDGLTAAVRPYEADSRQRLIDMRTGKDIGPPIPESENAVAGPDSVASFSRDGSTMAFTDYDSKAEAYHVTVWDVERQRRIVRFQAEDKDDGAYGGPQLSPDGRWVLTYTNTDGKETTRLWDASTGRHLRDVDDVRGLTAISPDGSLLVSAGGDVVELPSGKRRRNAFTGSDIGDLSFSPDGRTLAAVTLSGRVEIWDGAGRERRNVLVSGAVVGESHAGESLSGPVISDDGRYLAVRVGRAAVQVWDLGAKVALTPPMAVAGDELFGMAIDPDNVMRLLGAGTYAQFLDLDPERSVEAVCRRVGRDITREEWTAYAGGAAYRSVCPG